MTHLNNYKKGYSGQHPSSLYIAGFCSGQAAGCRGLPGMLSVHFREKHPQCVPHRSDGLHQQAAAPPEDQPHPPPLQKTSPPSQQVGFALFYLKKGEGQELFCHVSGDLLGYIHHMTPSPLPWSRGRGGGHGFIRASCWILPFTPPKTKHPSEEVDTSLSTCSWTF